MKVYELIEKLQQCDPNATVEFEDNDWCCEEIRMVRQDLDDNGAAIVVLGNE